MTTSASPQSNVTVPSIPHWVGGKAVAGTSSRAGDVFDPSTGLVSAKVPFASAAELDACVATAKVAFKSWAGTPPVRRARVMFRFRQLLESASDEIAAAISREHGKTLSDARGEVVRGLEVVEFACGIPDLIKGDHSENVGTGIDAFSLRQSLGVVAGITPFNFPAMVPLWMIPVALACGNAFILKPSERDPSASLLLAKLLQEAGLPDGVFNVLHGDKEAVDGLLKHPDVAAISFVGSTPVAKYIYTTGTQNGKRVQALGGAKNHMVIMPDAEVDDVVNALLGAAYGSAGERCMAISIAVMVGEAAATDRLLDKLIPRVKSLRVGSPFEGATEMGPLISREHRAKVCDYIAAGVSEGANLLIDGRVGYADKPGGFFLGGSLFDNVKTDMKIYKEEIFGPVLGLVRVPDLESAIKLINSHSYANGTAIFTRSGAAARAFTSGIEVGMVGVNIPLPVPMPFYSFGGWRGSLFGDHHIYGHEGVRFYTRLKAVTQRWPKDVEGRAEFSMPTMK
jgi:malonate-semialdehyde dehydrogenase (acetylating)/methylmalonate-semialdehyde dehydrogenase